MASAMTNAVNRYTYTAALFRLHAVVLLVENERVCFWAPGGIRVCSPSIPGWTGVEVIKSYRPCQWYSGQFLEAFWGIQTESTTLPNCELDSRYAWAAAASARANTRSTTGLSFPAAKSLITVSNSDFVPM